MSRTCDKLGDWIAPVRFVPLVESTAGRVFVPRKSRYVRAHNSIRLRVHQSLLGFRLSASLTGSERGRGNFAVAHSSGVVQEQSEPSVSLNDNDFS